MESKKNFAVKILWILEQYSDEEHRLSQQDIIDRLKKDYGVECERKAVARNVEALKSSGIEINTSKRGVYLLSRRFEKSELRLLIDSVLASRYIDNKHSGDLIAKLAREGGASFSEGVNPHLAYNREWDKTPNKSVFFTIELLDEAIVKKKKVRFIYNGYDLGKKLVPTRKGEWKVSPFFLLLHNQRYYLICNEDGKEGVSYYRVDRITDIAVCEETAKPLASVEGYEDIRPDCLDATFPYFLDGKPVQVVMRCIKTVFSDLVDWFGSRFTVTKNEGDYVEISLFAPEKAMKYWALQYGDSVEVLSPQSLRSDIADTIKRMSLLYGPER